MRKHVLAIAMTIAALLPTAASAGWGDCKSAGCAESCASGGCEPVLVRECKWVDVEKTCWKVECKDVAIPPVKLPRFGDCLKAICKSKAIGVLPESGGSSCTDAGCTDVSCTGCDSACDTQSCGDGLMSKLFGRHACGKVRTVAKLSSSKSKVKKQVVEWKTSGGSEGCGKSCTSGCTSGGCSPF